MARALLILLVLAMVWLALCWQPLSVLTPVTKDPSTSLYTIPIRYGANLFLDLTVSLVWSTCVRDHLPGPFSCKSSTCTSANAYAFPGYGGNDNCDKRWMCRAHPYNLVTGACTAGSLVHSRLIANTTDGTNLVSQVSVRIVESRAPNVLPLMAS